jgi:transcriptional regulator with XRE-family HTH domain
MTDVITEARFALRLYQNELAAKLGASRRTGQRWTTGESRPAAHQFLELAKLLLPVDRGLAARAAAEAGTTLQAAGLVHPEPPAPPPVAPRGVVDAVVCAAAEAMNLPPGAVRSAVLAAFARAREIGLSVEMVESALSEKGLAEQPAAEKKQQRQLAKKG